jgi:endonuclease/exonuclease/phosphatase family metal-dependent hydrolase
VRVLSWNLKHGRAVPSAGHHLLGEFADALSAWEWDVALLQEVPPWWADPLAAAAGAQARRALTSRNAPLPLRRALARRWPDLMRSNGGGANVILVRGEAIAEHRIARLRWRPERRVVHAVRLAGGTWVGNVHAQGHPAQAAQADTAAAAARLGAWATGGPFVLGGDFNLHAPVVAGLASAGGHDVDHVLVRSLQPAAPAQVLDRGTLSDHAPVLTELREGMTGHGGPPGA